MFVPLCMYMCVCMYIYIYIQLPTWFLSLHPSAADVVVAEWLRRWTRNPLGSPRAGSNPADYERVFFFFLTPWILVLLGRPSLKMQLASVLRWLKKKKKKKAATGNKQNLKKIPTSDFLVHRIMPFLKELTQKRYLTLKSKGLEIVASCSVFGESNLRYSISF